MEIWAIYVEGAPPCCSSRPFRALKLTGQNRPENRKEPWTNLELNPDVLSSFEAASESCLLLFFLGALFQGTLQCLLLSRSFILFQCLDFLEGSSFFFFGISVFGCPENGGKK